MCDPGRTFPKPVEFTVVIFPSKLLGVFCSLEVSGPFELSENHRKIFPTIFDTFLDDFSKDQILALSHRTENIRNFSRFRVQATLWGSKRHPTLFFGGSKVFSWSLSLLKSYLSDTISSRKCQLWKYWNNLQLPFTYGKHWHQFVFHFRPVQTHPLFHLLIPFSLRKVCSVQKPHFEVISRDHSVHTSHPKHVFDRVWQSNRNHFPPNSS